MTQRPEPGGAMAGVEPPRSHWLVLDRSYMTGYGSISRCDAGGATQAGQFQTGFQCLMVSTTHKGTPLLGHAGHNGQQGV